MSIFCSSGKYLKSLKQCACVRGEVGKWWWYEAYSLIQQNVLNHTVSGTVLWTGVLDIEQDKHGAYNLTGKTQANIVVIVSFVSSKTCSITEIQTNLWSNRRTLKDSEVSGRTEWEIWGRQTKKWAAEFFWEFILPCAIIFCSSRLCKQLGLWCDQIYPTHYHIPLRFPWLAQSEFYTTGEV